MLAEAIVKRATERVEATNEAVTDGLTNIVHLAGSLADTARIAKALNYVAEAEGAYEVFASFAQVSANLVDDQPMTWFGYTAQRFATADDTWSGRENDVRRAKADGQRKALQEIFAWVTR